jgi:hypothetical protein
MTLLELYYLCSCGVSCRRTLLTVLTGWWQSHRKMCPQIRNRAVIVVSTELETIYSR